MVWSGLKWYCRLGTGGINRAEIEIARRGTFYLHRMPGGRQYQFDRDVLGDEASEIQLRDKVVAGPGAAAKNVRRAAGVGDECDRANADQQDPGLLAAAARGTVMAVEIAAAAKIAVVRFVTIVNQLLVCETSGEVRKSKRNPADGRNPQDALC